VSIEVVVGLPHLNNGPILARAKLMQQPMLISANCLSKWRNRAGWRSWEGWRHAQLRNAVGLASLDLDSAGYVLASRYGGFPWSIADYMALAASYPFRRIAAADYCCEAQIAGDREEVLDRISRTIATNRECRARAADLGIIERLMPVLQGRIDLAPDRRDLPCFPPRSHRAPRQARWPRSGSSSLTKSARCYSSFFKPPAQTARRVSTSP
jgi:hypothetical protein